MIIETIHVPGIGHVVKPIFGGFQTQQFLMDQSQTSGGGGIMKPVINLNLAQNDTFMIHIKPPSGTQFQIVIPDGEPRVYFKLNLGRIIIYTHDGQGGHNDIPDVSEIFSVFSMNNIGWKLNSAKINFVNLQYEGKKPSRLAPQVGYFEHAAGIYLKADVVFHASATFDEIIIDGQYAPPSFPPNAYFDYYPARWVSKFPPLQYILVPNPYVYFFYNKWTNSTIKPGRFIHII